MNSNLAASWIVSPACLQLRPFGGALPPAAARWVSDIHLILTDITIIYYEEVLLGNLDGAGVIHIHWDCWASHPLC